MQATLHAGIVINNENLDQNPCVLSLIGPPEYEVAAFKTHYPSIFKEYFVVSSTMIRSKSMYELIKQKH